MVRLGAAGSVPSDTESEENALASAMVCADDVMPDFVGIITPNDFWIKENRWIYEAILHLWYAGEEVNQVTVAKRLADKGLIEDVGGTYHLAEMIQSLPTPIGADWYARRVADAARRREMISTASQLNLEAHDNTKDAAEIRDAFVSKLLGIGSVGEDKTVPIDVIVTGMMDEIDTWAQDPRRLAGFRTGWALFDIMMGGLAGGRVSVVGADTGAGKSQFALNTAIRAAKSDIPVQVFTTEMSKEETTWRLASIEAGFDREAAKRRGYLLDFEHVALIKAVDTIAKLPIYVCAVPNPHLSLLQGEARRYSMKCGTKLLVVDHLDFIRADGRERVAQLKEITAGIKAIAQSLNLHVMGISHINRAGQREGIAHYSLRDSSSKEQDADQIILLSAVEQRDDGEWRPIAKDRVAEVVRKEHGVNIRTWITKNRHGTEGYVYMRLDWGAGGRYAEIIPDD